MSRLLQLALGALAYTLGLLGSLTVGLLWRAVKIGWGVLCAPFRLAVAAVTRVTLAWRERRLQRTAKAAWAEAQAECRKAHELAAKCGRFVAPFDEQALRSRLRSVDRKRDALLRKLDGMPSSRGGDIQAAGQLPVAAAAPFVVGDLVIGGRSPVIKVEPPAVPAAPDGDEPPEQEETPEPETAPASTITVAGGAL